MKIQRETQISEVFSVDKIINVYYVELTAYKMKHNNPVVNFDYWQMLYLEQGRYTCSIDGKLFHLTQGQGLLCAPGENRFVVDQTDARLAYISFRCESEMMELVKDKLFLLDPEQKLLVSRIFTIGLSRFVNIPHQEQYYGQEVLEGTANTELQIMKNSLELLLIGLADSTLKEILNPSAENQTKYYKNLFEKIVHYMKQHLCESITMQDISAHTGVSKATVKRVFHQCADTGAIHYFNQLKIEQAQTLIRTTDKSLSEISEILGFSSIHYFSRIFKKVTGITPSQYGKTVIKHE